jgi:hypothetical protein
MDYNRDRNEFIEKFKIQQNPSKIVTERTKSKERDNNVNMNTRWDYLFQLSKVQQVRKKQKAELKQKENSLNEINMCTFSPKVNKSQADGYTAESNNLSIIDRHSLWNQKKQTKLEQIKNELVNKEYDECHFRPKIVTVNNLELS